MDRVLTLILAGGKGRRLEPLTLNRAKPAVPFGGGYRIIDFTLSNCINSGLRKLLVLTQYRCASLDRHINRCWSFLRPEFDEFIETLPPQQRLNNEWYRGTADAVFQNIYSIEQSGSEHVLILSGDHIYQMNYAELIVDHINAQSDATIACLPVPIQHAHRFGVMATDSDRRIVRFDEKPVDPPPIPDQPDFALASMGIYVFRTEFLFEQLCRDAVAPDTQRDFGRNIIPSIIQSHRVRAWPFVDEYGRAEYWRDVGTIDSYYESVMDLLAEPPPIDLYTELWPIRSWSPPLPPPIIRTGRGDPQGSATLGVHDGIIGPGSVINRALVSRSVLSSRVNVHADANVEDSIIFDKVTIGGSCDIRRAIIDKGVVIPPGTRIGCDPVLDRGRGFTISDAGVVVVTHISTVAADPSQKSVSPMLH